MPSPLSQGIRSQIDFLRAEKNFKFDLKTRLTNDLIDVAMLKRFLLYWRDQVTEGQWTVEDGQFFNEAMNEVRFTRDDPHTPYDETTIQGIRERLYQVAEKNFGTDFAREVVLRDDWDQATDDDIQRLLAPSGQVIDNILRKFLANQVLLDGEIYSLDGEIQSLTNMQIQAADDTSDVED